MKKNNTTEFYYGKSILIYLLMPLALIYTWTMVFLKGMSSEDFYPILIFSIILPLVFISRIKALRLFFSNRPALILTQDSIINANNDLNIAWSDISELKIKIYRGAYLSIKLKDKEKYISKLTNPIARLLTRLNSKISHGTFLIELGLIKDNYKDIYASVIEYYDGQNERKK